MNILFYEEEPEQEDVKKLESLEKEIIKISVEELKEKYPGIIENLILQNNCKSSSKNNINRTERLNKVLNKTSGNPYHDEKGRFTFNPGQGRGVGKPARCFSSPTVIYTGDDIKLEKDGVILEGTLQYKDGKFYLLTDKEKGNLIEISKDDIRKSIVSKSAKEKQKELLESQGIRHKTPKERRTPEQKRLISELDKMGLLKDKEFGAWCMKYADEETLADIYTTLREAESFGLNISSIQLGKIRSGQTWGRAYYRTDGNFKLALSGQIYDRNPIQEMKIKECREGFHTDNSIKAVVRHEAGHIISYQNAQRSFNTKDKPKNIWQQEDKIDSYCGKVVSEAMGYSYFTYRETLKDLKNCSNSEISEYGRTNFKEAIAESWSNPNYSLFTKKVSDILKKDLNKPRENSIVNERTEEIPICSGYGPEFEDFEYETSTGKVKTNSRIMRLCSLEKVINKTSGNPYHDEKGRFASSHGQGSGSFNPGQGRGVDKPNKGGIFDKSEFQIKNEWDNIDDNVELDKDTEKFLKTYYFGSWFFGNVQRIARQKNIDIMNSFEKKQSTKVMETLDNLINKSNLSKDAVLFRGITMTDDNANSIKKGSIISDSGFASSTIDPNKAIIKKGRPETGGKRNIILMKIDAKKGQKALKSPIDTEYEFVLPRNSKFKVKSVSEPNNNIRIVEVEYE